MRYDDLLEVPFKLNGRNKDGMDCYGLVLELCARGGKTLYDLNAVHVPKSALYEASGKVNVIQIDEKDAGAGDIVQCSWNDEIHVAYLLDRRTCIHMTTGGVRITPTIALRDRKFFKVV